MAIPLWLERAAFKAGMKSQLTYEWLVRPAAYAMSGWDAEQVHDLGIEMLNRYEEVLQDMAPEFCVGPLYTILNSKAIMPFGTAGGMDKNGEALVPLSHVFGFLESGTVTFEPRDGNPRPRIVAANGDIYNAQGLPSRGVVNFLKNVKNYRYSRTGKPVYANITGIPGSRGLDDAYHETDLLLTTLSRNVDGFVWNPSCPNSNDLVQLRSSNTFREYAELFAKRANDKLKLVKISPYEFEDVDARRDALQMADAWMAGGGDGFVAVNTYSVPRDKVPSNEWGHKSAGRSGKFLKPYMLRAVRDMRSAFPKSVIIGVGGIETSGDAYETFAAGADAVEAYTAYAVHGFGALHEMMHGLANRLEREGYEHLEEFKYAKWPK